MKYFFYVVMFLICQQVVTQSFQVKSIILARVMELKSYLEKNKEIGKKLIYYFRYVNNIDNFLKHPDQFKKEIASEIPDGSSIGTISCGFGHL